MDETPDQIRSEIEHTRYRLGQDLDALEFRVKQETDWRVQFNRNPWVCIGVAFGMAFLVGIAVGSTGKS